MLKEYHTLNKISTLIFLQNTIILKKYSKIRQKQNPAGKSRQDNLVGVTGLEPVTLCL